MNSLNVSGKMITLFYRVYKITCAQVLYYSLLHLLKLCAIKAGCGLNGKRQEGQWCEEVRHFLEGCLESKAKASRI